MRFQRFLRKLKAIGSIAFNIIQLIAALLGIIATSIGALIFAWLHNWQQVILPIFSFMTGIIMTLTLLLIFVWKSSPPRWLLRGYRHVKWETIYKIHEDNYQHHSFENIVEIEATQAGIHIFEDTYQWTGRGKEEVPQIISAGHSLMGNIIQRSGWTYFYVHLGHDLSIGERVTIKTLQELYDDKNQFQPFLAKIISQPMDYLLLRVLLPKSHLPSHSSFTEYNTVGPASKVIGSRPGAINKQSGEILWEIPNPIFGHRYEISWS